jgi:Raf kinase inhibitor-like YbhB/YbcL family protein
MGKTKCNVRKGRRTAAVVHLGALFVIMLFSCRDGENDMDKTTRAETAQIQVTSSAFAEGGMIPPQYTCDGGNVSPPLSWQSVPEGTKSVALIADDPDAPARTFVHWVLYDLPADVRELPEDVPNEKTTPVGARQGINDFGEIGYGGPCPPSGTHRYYFKLYALDAQTNLPPGSSKAKLLDAMKGHVLAEGQIMGRYKRQ